MPAPTETRAVTINMSERVFAGLIDHGRKAGYTPTLYAQLLFEAAWAARVGKGEDDPLLVACVEKGLSRPPPLPSRPAPPIALPPPAAAPVLRVVPVPVLVPVPIAVPIVRATRCEPPAEAMTAADAPVDASPVEAPPPAPPKPASWSPSQMTFARLVCREEGASYAEVRAALAPAYQEKTSLLVLVSAVRKKLGAEGIAFEPVGVWGWRVERAYRAAADAFLGRMG